MQIKADVLQAPYQSLSRSDLSTLGSAIIAGSAVGMFKDAKTITERFVKPKRTVQPQPGAERSYLRNIEVYRDLFHLLPPIYSRLAGHEA